MRLRQGLGCPGKKVGPRQEQMAPLPEPLAGKASALQLPLLSGLAKGKLHTRKPAPHAQKTATPQRLQARVKALRVPRAESTLARASPETWNGQAPPLSADGPKL